MNKSPETIGFSQQLLAGIRRDIRPGLHHSFDNRRHTGYPGGIYETTFREMQDKHPGRALEIAVKGMLPKGPLGYAMIKKLKIYAGAEHPHSAQQPKVLDL